MFFTHDGHVTFPLLKRTELKHHAHGVGFGVVVVTFPLLKRTELKQPGLIPQPYSRSVTFPLLKRTELKLLQLAAPS